MYKLIFAIFLLINSICFAQNDKDRFKEVFDSEIADETTLDRSSHSGRYQHTVAQQVPDWFINPPTSDGQSMYAVGISDPGMDTIQGLEMALFRAEIMANIFRKSTTQLLCDFFLNEQDQSNSIVYEHYSRITTKLPNSKGNYDIIKSYRNEYDETMVLIVYNPPTKVVSNELYPIRFELYKNETESSTYGVFESVYEIVVKSNSYEIPDPVFYELTELEDRSEVVSKSFEEEIKVPIYSLAYMGIPSSDSVKQCYFSHGLWKEYFKSVMVYIIKKAREKPENISFLGDKYNVESYQKLTRGVSVNKMRFALTGFCFENGKLKAKMTELALE
ncbi:MAG: hypothetical protein JEZ09_04095 [Salinivirgaceae bacterium]|nr:hypothetical protein [Salinivirgaceae bacterium]